MYNHMKPFRSRLFLFLVSLGLILIVAGSAVAAEIPAGVEQKEVIIISKMNMFAGTATKDSRFLDPEHEDIDQMVGLIIVETKRKRGQKLTDSATYRFNGNTIVRTGKGRAVTMNELLIPCKAKIYFYPNSRKAPVLYGIDMIGRYKNSRTRWNKDNTEE